MSDIKVVGWESYEESAARPEAVGGGGGIMQAFTEELLLDMWEDGAKPYIKAIFRALDETGPICGSDHQSERCPIFSDGLGASFSMRGWGDIVAAWWNTRFPAGEMQDYRTFAWFIPADISTRWASR